MAALPGADLAAGQVTDRGLLGKADRFARDLSHTVSAFTGCEHEFRASVGAQSRVAVSGPEDGVQLTVSGTPHLTLVILFYCSWDRGNEFLAVEESKFSVFPGSKTSGEPLFRYEYVRTPTGCIPSAHLQIARSIPSPHLPQLDSK